MPDNLTSLHATLPALVRERLLAGDDAVEVGRALIAAGTAALAGALGARIACPVAMLVVAEAAEVADGK
ncbi:hypothetical protein Snov_4358 [Ancylobacter novellus DSM 506]|uniref:Uncharacterized protein n=1 Tax=Ancylobacter novellus (strain ATCC 8093 / DSM 506 / JCM 20403 / CCM 1077 / IAM 12100 / NBRC 12443 / NCIMB 10456) TaxID=639283 RepID=D7A2T7_ANCN5|nr:hypothetical protein [Ancylobacter novellus]ADH91617.1 hypothetical protein Snov_4358 [Ancylobacter novellus DSM 506]